MQRVLLIIGGGIAAYKAPELVRRLRDHGLGVRCLLTSAAAQFVAPLSLASVSGDRVYENLFDLTDEAIYREVYPLITNPRALEVSAAWAGNSGRLVKNSSETFTHVTPAGALASVMPPNMRPPLASPTPVPEAIVLKPGIGG